MEDNLRDKWEYFEYTVRTFKVIEELKDNNAGAAALGMTGLYRIYSLGAVYAPDIWKQIGIGNIPKVEDLDNQHVLLNDESSIVIFHKKHEKFGTNIVESASLYHPNVFVFFDYEMIEKVFYALDNGDEVPHVPNYYATIYDRHDFKSCEHLWKSYDPNLKDMFNTLSSKKMKLS